MNWVLFVTKVPSVVQGLVHLYSKVKAAGADKKAALLSVLPDSMELAEFAVGKDLFNDPEVMKLVSALIDAEAAVLKAREAVKAGLLARK
jgi:hypothetical protein